VQEGIVHLLSTIVLLFPAAFHSNYDKIEAAIASKIFSAKTSSNMLKKFAHFLALLPKAKGDEGTWSLMMQKLLISINVHLNNFFQGLEEGNLLISLFFSFVFGYRVSLREHGDMRCRNKRNKSNPTIDSSWKRLSFAPRRSKWGFG
jgi:hypothetical protein